MERNTNQRRAIRQALMDARRPLSPQEILDAARPHAEKLGIATVYRTIRELIREDWLAPVELPGEPARYELAHIGHHHHFYCRSCGRVFDLDGCLPSIEQVLPRGFVAESHEFVFYGRCDTCKPDKGKASRGTSAQANHDHGHAHDHAHDHDHQPRKRS